MTCAVEECREREVTWRRMSKTVRGEVARIGCVTWGLGLESEVKGRSEIYTM